MYVLLLMLFNFVVAASFNHMRIHEGFHLLSPYAIQNCTVALSSTQAHSLSGTDNVLV